MDFNQNNLNRSTSPYLQQHHDNPICWQEWSKEVLEYAQQEQKIIFVSIGYAACHWCHVMAREAFSDQQIAIFLNQFFVSIKVDREQRPDLDHYFLAYLQQTQGSGGWPLNVFLTPERKPFYALTYAPLLPHHGLPGFLEIVHSIKDFHDRNRPHLPAYALEIQTAAAVEEAELVAPLLTHLTDSHGPQFPPATSLLFLLHYYEQNPQQKMKEVIENLLEIMATRGLHDHLQGGFYRYCVDESWTIPHFEKMLYDQALLLWVYSAAYKLFPKSAYKTIIEKVVICLEETFLGDGLFYAAHDADADHEEGATYLWTREELQTILTEEEFQTMEETYLLTPNFEGKIHLVKQKWAVLPEIERKLLQYRQQRVQPFVDKKYVTSWNALAGIGLVLASRMLNNTLLAMKAKLVGMSLLKKHYINGKVVHSSYAGKLQEGEFLEDYAALLLLATYLSEEESGYLDLIKELEEKLSSFYFNESWIESKTADFMALPAASFDHPYPSPLSLAEMATVRAKIILGKEYEPGEYQHSVEHDFFNLATFLRNGNWHLIHGPHRIQWQQLPLNCLQIQNKIIQNCYKGGCEIFKDVTALLAKVR